MEWDDDRENIGSQPQEMGLLRDNIVATGDDGSKGMKKKKKKKVASQNYCNEKDKQEKQMKMNLQQWEKDPSCSSSWRLMKCLHWGP